MRAAALFLCALALAGCRKESRGSAPPLDNTSDAGAISPPSPDAGTSACVAQCIKDNQMRATSPEQIEADCRRDCATRP